MGTNGGGQPSVGKQISGLTKVVWCIECRERDVLVEPKRRPEGVVCLVCINKERAVWGLQPIANMYTQRDV